MRSTVSIIVPVYNVEKYIDECIQSILGQTYDKWELILVDDGSPDNCGKICDDYSAGDERIRVIHKPNGGLSDARNAALDIMTGEYITFIDSDDYISADYLEKMLYCIDKYKADVVQCDFSRNMEDVGTRSSKTEVTVLHSDRILSEFLRFRSPKVFSCGKIYKAYLFDHIRFPVGLIDEDNYTTYKTFLESDTFVNLNYRLYYYRVNQASITNRSFGTGKFGILNCIPEIREELDKKGYDLTKDIDYYELRQLIQLYNKAVLARACDEYKTELMQIKARIHTIAKDLGDIDIKYRFMLFALLHFDQLYKRVILRLRK